jgi:glyoxylase-like metal-dependent hydrolase (beta-lactamase superfamily II)
VLKQVADGLRIHSSEFCESNAVVVDGTDGVLVIDPGVLATEMECLANDLAGTAIEAGFSTHPHWDHLLWHASLGDAPRHATALAATTARERLANGIDAQRLGIPDGVDLDMVGGTSGLPEGASTIPWNGPAIRIIEHNAHASGHAALWLEDACVLVAGDMLSDVLVPLLDFTDPSDPIQHYLDALDGLEVVADGVDVVIPGHGSVGDGTELRTRIARDRAYVTALRESKTPDDPRIGPNAKPGWDWVAGVHNNQVQQLALRRERDARTSREQEL